MPSGVFIESDDLDSKTVDSTKIPKLAGTNGVVPISQVSALVFDRFGKLKPDSQAVEIRVGEKTEPTGSFLISDDNHFLLRVRPLTGRVTVEDRATNSSP
jgi:hypothetical protein